MKTVLRQVQHRLWWLIVLLLLIRVGNVSAQFVTIPDTSFVSWLNAQGYSACMSGNQLDTTCQAILTDSIISFYLPFNVDNFSGLQYFKNLKELTIGYQDTITYLPLLADGLKELSFGNIVIDLVPPLPASLETLYAQYCNIGYFDSFPDSLVYISLYDNGLTTLPNLPYGLKKLSCGMNQITVLPTLPNTLTELWCNDNPIANLPALPDSLVILACYYCQLITLPTLPSSLTVIWAYGNNISTLPTIPDGIMGLDFDQNQLTAFPDVPPSLKWLKVGWNQLSSLPDLSQCGKPFYLKCHNNDLTYLPSLPDTLSGLNCTNNPNLGCLPPIKHINGNSNNSNTTIVIFNTLIECLPGYISHPHYWPSIDTLPLCGIFNTYSCDVAWNLAGKLYIDSDSNCIAGNNEPGVGPIKMMLYENGNLTQQVYSNGGGEYSFDTDLGAYELQVDTNDAPYYVSCPIDDSLSVDLTPTDSFEYDLNFAVQCKQGFDLGIKYITRSSGIFFPGNTSELLVAAGDLTSLYGASCASIQSGELELVINGPVTYQGVPIGALLPSSVNGDTLTWQISDWSSVDVFTSFRILLQTDTSATAFNNICFIASITSTNQTGDTNPGNGGKSICFPVVNSFDPNIKEVYPLVLYPNEWSTYTIHFQNTGSAAAQHIQIIDTLDSNLSWSTFQLLGYSHDNLTQVLLNGIVHFNFPNINLPDSTSDEPNSHGWIQYRIKTDSTITSGTTIHNTASIYFDFNDPIVTNDAIVSYCVPQTVSQDLQVCEGDSVQVGTNWYHQAGSYTNLLQNQFGCDSTVTTLLSVLQPSSTELSIAFCQNDSVEVNGEWFHQAGSFVQSLLNSSGCDSLLTVNVSLLQPSSFDQSFTICTGESVSVGDSVYNTPGTYVNNFQNVSDCDSIVTTNLIVDQLNTTVTLNNATLTAANGLTYQWINCDNNQNISGATNQSYTAAQNGNYQVQVTDADGCSALSSCFNVIVAGVEMIADADFVLYPNPAQNSVTISYSSNIQNAQLQLTDLSGRIILTKTLQNTQTILALDDLASGSYVLRLLGDKKLLGMKNLTVIK